MAPRTGQAILEVLLLCILVFLAQVVSLTFGLSGMEFFALSVPLSEYPWTIVVSVYAHGGIDHLIANIIGLLVFGFIVERRSSRARFHAFVLGTGAIAGIAEVLVGSMLGPSPLVLGISGAVFALMGYVLTSNPVAESVFGWLEMDLKVQLVLMVVLALAITWITRGERVALVAHFTGFLLGLIAGRAHLLKA